MNKFIIRQTISSWETGKSYPDVHSLILLSKTFEITIDQLIKGDLIEMKKAVKKDDITKMDKYSKFMIIGYAVSVIGVSLSWYLGSIIGLVLASLIYVMALYFAFKVEKIKKQYDVHTYREILAFSKGETLDEISKIKESGKVKYQKILLTLGSMVLGATVSTIIFRILQAIR